MAPDHRIVRRFLTEVLPTDSDFNAFCLDYYPSIYRRFGAEMNRVTKENLLLELTEHSDLLARLQQAFPDAYQKKGRLLAPRANQLLVEKLDHLYQRRDNELAQNKNTKRIDEEICLIKRQMRQEKPQLSAGEVLGDRYRLEQVIGSGGFADVWLAKDRVTRTSVAVKVLHSRFLPEQEQWQRVSRGARTMATLSRHHFGFVRVLTETLAVDNGFYYFVLEYLSGGDLHRAVLDGSLTCEQALAAVQQVGEALHFAHTQKLVHRDVKPQNVLLDANGQAKLTDFDLVALSDSTGGTRTGALGTFIYAAPEEMEDAKSVDQRADIYSLGVTAVFAIYGRDLNARFLQSKQKFIAKLNCSLATKMVLNKATAWEPSERYQTVNEFCHDLAFSITQIALTDRIVVPNITSTNDSESPKECSSTDDLGRIGPYKVLRLLDKGSIGAVYEAIQEPIGRQVAIKVLYSKYAQDPILFARFRAEAIAVNAVLHPGIVQISDWAQLTNGTSFLVMEYLDGELLSHRIERYRGRLPLVQILRIAWQVACTIAAVHEKGIAHLDLQPRNIMIVPDPIAQDGERVKVLNFGIARLDPRTRQEHGLPLELPWDDVVMGTPRYMAPEQCRGGIEVGTQADVYSFGVMTYEILAGRPPFTGSSGEVLAMHVYEPPPALLQYAPHVPSVIISSVERMLAKRKEDRPTMSEIGANFEHWLQLCDASKSMLTAPSISSHGNRSDDYVSNEDTLILSPGKSPIK